MTQTLAMIHCLFIYFFASLAVSNFFFSSYEVIYACAYVFDEYNLGV